MGRTGYACGQWVRLHPLPTRFYACNTPEWSVGVIVLVHAPKAARELMAAIQSGSRPLQKTYKALTAQAPSHPPPSMCTKFTTGCSACRCDCMYAPLAGIPLPASVAEEHVAAAVQRTQQLEGPVGLHDASLDWGGVPCAVGLAFRGHSTQ